MHNEGGIVGRLSRLDPRQTLGTNVRRLRAWYKERKPGDDRGTQAGIARLTNLAQPTIGRIERGAHATELDTITALANAFKIEPWQLLTQDLDPDDLYQLVRRSVYRRLWQLWRGGDDLEPPPPE